MTPKRNTARIGMVGYARILRSLMLQPGSLMDLRQRDIGKRNTIVRTVAALHRAGLLHVARWDVLPHCKPRAVYAYRSDDEDDAPPPATRQTGRAVESPARPVEIERIPPELLTFVKLVEALQAPLKVGDLVAEVGIQESTCRVVLQGLRELRLVHIADWQPRNNPPGPPVALYAWGPDRPDARKRTIGRAERNRRYRERRAKREVFARIVPALAPMAGAAA